MATRKQILKYSLAALVVAVLLHTYITIQKLPRRFEISGKIEECCSDAEMLRNVNNKVVNLTERLSETLFFKIFRVNLFKECPFWAQELLCTSPVGRCQVCHCDENDVPLPWRQEKSSPINQVGQDIFQLEWHVEEKEHENGIYVDLKKNPEVYTGYQGQNIWDVIYKENCFSGPMENMCMEERLLNRIISGLHTSISTQLSEYYNNEKNRTYPNVTIFFEKVGKYPERMTNLYFAHSVLLRAINRAHEYIKSYNFDTGNFHEDLQTRYLLDELYKNTLENCDNPFDEKILFANLSRPEVNKRFISYFRNISKIMDCVECETCKVYGKLQTLGISAALKILFAEKFTGKSEIKLNRNEIIALMVTFYKFSTSLSYIDKMFERRYREYDGMFKGILVSFLVFGITLWILIKIYREKTMKLSNGLSQNFKVYSEIEKKQKKN